MLLKHTSRELNPSPDLWSVRGFLDGLNRTEALILNECWTSRATGPVQWKSEYSRERRCMWYVMGSRRKDKREQDERHAAVNCAWRGGSEPDPREEPVYFGLCDTRSLHTAKKNDLCRTSRNGSWIIWFSSGESWIIVWSLIFKNIVYRRPAALCV